MENTLLRSRIMAAVRSVDTTPEMVVRRILRSLGYRFSLHEKSLPGSPDIVFKRRHKVIFVHGCFWHRHRCKNGTSTPKARRAYWQHKFDRNCQRDSADRRQLKKLGWEVLVIWECGTRKPESLKAKLLKFIEGSDS